ncbi:MAG: hypothetical protein EOP62_12325 [Sphingomonadales bacterium]|nr:MAG: hypothetical protein EOP62_12325 [Sphingomonadales bacterium]
MFSQAARLALFMCPVLAISAPTASAAVQRGVDGRNVTRVFHTGPGSFEQTENGRWIEFGDDGRLIHQFEERRRDANRIELFDTSRGVRVWIDLRTREISGAPAFGSTRLLYRITDIDAGQRGRGWRGRRGGDNGGGWDRGNGGRGPDRGPNRGPDRGNGGSGWGRESTRSIEVGPIWNQRDAETKCANKAREMRGEWTGQWSTTVQGRMSVCEIRFR